MKQKTLTATEIEHILELPPARRAHAIIDSQDAREVLEAISTQDSFLIIKEAFGSDSQILLQYLPPDKLSAFIDLDCWEGDTLSQDSLFEWMTEISQASTETLLEAFDTLDLEVLVLMFQPYMSIYVTQPTDDNIPEFIAAGYETFDNNYFFCFSDDTEQTTLLRSILDTLFLHNQEMYYRILEGVRWEMVSSMEEAAWRNRSLRLMELGFPTPDEAGSVYQRVRTDKILARRGLDPALVPRLDGQEYHLPSMYMGEIKEDALMRACLDELPQAERDRFLFELVFVTNKIIMAGYKPLNDAEALKHGAQKAVAFTALGLQLAMRVEQATPREILQDMNAEALFSLGYNAVLDLQQRLKAVIEGVKIDMIPGSSREDVQGLLRRRPQYQDRDVFTLEELDALTRMVDNLSALRTIIHHIPWKGHMLEKTNIGLEGLDMENVILTALAVNILQAGLLFRPLSMEELRALLEKTTLLREGVRSCKPGFAADLAAFIQTLDEALDSRSAESAAAGLVQRLDEEIAGLNDLDQADPRYITCLVVMLVPAAGD